MTAIADAPVWLNRLSTEPSPEARPTRKFMSPGSRNNDLTSLAGMMRRKGWDEPVISHVLHAANDNGPEPLTDAEVQRIASGVMRYSPNLLAGLTQQTFSDILVQRARDRALYCPEWGWMINEGKRWTRDKKDLQILTMAKALATDLSSEAERMAERDPTNAKELRKKGRSCQNRNFLKGAIDLAAADPGIRAEVEEFDARPNLFNVLNGTLDTATGVFQSHSPADRLTKLGDVEYDPSATCPTFDRFMAEVLATDVTGFLMRSVAYALLGLGNEQKLVILIGKGRNGKSTFTSVIETIFGDYAVAADPRTFSLRNEDSIRNDVARLAGSRLVTTTEFRSGMILDPALIKKMTGGDKITARRLYEEPFEFKGRRSRAA